MNGDGELLELIATLKRDFVVAVTREVVAEIKASGVYIAQTNSPLGPRVHCAAVRRRMSEGDERAVRHGRKYYLTEEALQEELSRRGGGPAVTKAAPPKSTPPSMPDEEREVYESLMRRFGRGA